MFKLGLAMTAVLYVMHVSSHLEHFRPSNVNEQWWGERRGKQGEIGSLIFQIDKSLKFLLKISDDISEGSDRGVRRFMLKPGSATISTISIIHSQPS